jgi:hypothetical protein
MSCLKYTFQICFYLFGLSAFVLLSFLISRIWNLCVKSKAPEIRNHLEEEAGLWGFAPIKGTRLQPNSGCLPLIRSCSRVLMRKNERPWYFTTTLIIRKKVAKKTRAIMREKNFKLLFALIRKCFCYAFGFLQLN